LDRTGRRFLGYVVVGILAGLLLYALMPDGTSYEGVPPNAPQEVRDAMGRLRSRRPARRAAAAKRLAEMEWRAWPSVPFLVALLTDEEDGAGWTEKLVRTIHPLAGQQPVWGAAASALEKIGEPAIDPLKAALGSLDANVRRRVAGILGGMRLPAATEALIPATKDSVPAVRSAALTWVIQNQHAQAKEILLFALQDPDAGVRRSAAVLIGSEHGPEGVDALVKLTEDPDADLRHFALERLCFLEDPRTAAVLRAAVKDPHAPTRAAVIAALFEMKDPQGIDLLLDGLKDPELVVRAFAASRLKNQRDPRTIDPLIVALSDPDDAVRRYAAEALTAISGQDFGQDAERWRRWHSESGYK